MWTTSPLPKGGIRYENIDGESRQYDVIPHKRYLEVSVRIWIHHLRRWEHHVQNYARIARTGWERDWASLEVDDSLQRFINKREHCVSVVARDGTKELRFEHFWEDLPATRHYQVLLSNSLEEQFICDMKQRYGIMFPADEFAAPADERSLADVLTRPR